MYDELVKRLRTATTLPVMNALCQEDADAIEELSKLVDESIPKDDAEIIIAEVAKPRWIPLTDRLPEKFENCLIANKRGKHYEIDKGWWNGSFFDRCAKGGYHNVTHWMPLPEPPKEEAT